MTLLEFPICIYFKEPKPVLDLYLRGKRRNNEQREAESPVQGMMNGFLHNM